MLFFFLSLMCSGLSLVHVAYMYGLHQTTLDRIFSRVMSCFLVVYDGTILWPNNEVRRMAAKIVAHVQEYLRGIRFCGRRASAHPMSGPFRLLEAIL